MVVNRDLPSKSQRQQCTYPSNSLRLATESQPTNKLQDPTWYCISEKLVDTKTGFLRHPRSLFHLFSVLSKNNTML